ncbi:hypothetical protein EIP86_009750 [Pleurotus ostreatoroseus]|nr:hypothetical protein EIP86_009750 [Pleurotus ostreatoroseus]
MATSSASTDIPPLGKYLASTDKKTRDKAVKSLTVFLSDPSRDVLPQSEMAKLWKGFWMSDKPLVQQALATDIANILLAIPNMASSLAFLRGFWEAISREWSGIDRLRMDKYYMLIRRFVNATFRLLMRAQWDEAAIADPGDMRVPSSLTCHIADIYLEELDKAYDTSPVEDPLPAPLSMLLQPLYDTMARTPTNATYTRIQSAFLDSLLSVLSEHDGQFEDEDEDEERSPKRMRLSHPSYNNILHNSCADAPKSGPLPQPNLKRSVLNQVFETASQETTRDANRRKLYAFVKANSEDDEDKAEQ